MAKAVFKCKMCGGDLDVTEGSAVVCCNVCNTEQTVPNAAVLSLLKRVEISLEDGEWDEADKHSERILDIDPECAQAYFGKLMASLHCVNREALLEVGTDIEDNLNVKRIRRFGSQEDVAFIDECIRKSKPKGMDVSCPYCNRAFHVNEAILEKGYGNCPYCSTRLNFEPYGPMNTIGKPTLKQRFLIGQSLD